MEVVEKIAVIIAILLLSIGVASSLQLEKIDRESEDILSSGILNVNGQNFSFQDIFMTGLQKQINNSYGTFDGVMLSFVLEKAGVKQFELYDYTFVGADGYKKTIPWDDVQDGIITEERRIIFQDLPRAFFVRDVIKIEVN